LVAQRSRESKPGGVILAHHRPITGPSPAHHRSITGPSPVHHRPITGLSPVTNEERRARGLTEIPREEGVDWKGHGVVPHRGKPSYSNLKTRILKDKIKEGVITKSSNSKVLNTRSDPKPKWTKTPIPSPKLLPTGGYHPTPTGERLPTGRDLYTFKHRRGHFPLGKLIIPHPGGVIPHPGEFLPPGELHIPYTFRTLSYTFRTHSVQILHFCTHSVQEEHFPTGEDHFTPFQGSLPTQGDIILPSRGVPHQGRYHIPPSLHTPQQNNVTQKQ